MNEELFVERREQNWQRLSALCDRTEFNPTSLTMEEVDEFVTLYKRVSGDLSAARTKSDNTGLIEFLNDLTGRAYGILYRERAVPIGQAIWGAIELSAQVFRRRFAFIAIAIAVFFSGLFLTQLGLKTVPALRDPLIPPMMDEAFDQWRTGKFDEKSGTEGFASTGFYMSNNPRVSLVAGAIGAGTLGIGSVYMLFTNGAILGALLHEIEPFGRVSYVLSSIFPHGVPELSGIFVSGGAGLLLGWTLINPGRRTRAQALQAVGRDVMVLLCTAIVLMFIAAPIEGFFSFDARVPMGLKIAVGTVELIGWTCFWVFVGRKEEETA